MKGKVLALVAVLLMLSAQTVLAQDYCYGDFDHDGDVKDGDISLFKANMGRFPMYNPCPPESVWKIFQDGTDESVSWVDHAPNPRFAVYDPDTPGDNSDDLVLDKDTGLIWARDANLAGETKTWQDSINFCRFTVLGKRSGFRLPTQEELSSLVDPSQTGPSLPIGNPFINVQSDYYWTSTTREVDSRYARYVYFATGLSGSSVKPNIHWAWPVFGGNGYATGDW